MIIERVAAMIKWLREKFRKPVKYRVVFHSRGAMGNVVVLHRQVVTAKNETDAFWKAIAADRETYLNKTYRYKVKWYAYNLEGE